jgi:hypothetical protein
MNRKRAWWWRSARLVTGCLVAVLALAVAPPEARASGYDLVFGGGRLDGNFLSDNGQALDDLFLQVEFGGPSSKIEVRAPYVRINRTGNVTFTPEGAAILGAGGEGKPSWQESDAGDSASGWGDLLVRWRTYMIKAGGGNRPTLALVLDYKWATADEKHGLGTGENDYGGGLDYVQPLGKVFQIRGSAFYRFTGSPEGVKFNDRLSLAGGFGIMTAHTSWRLGYETVNPILDEVPLYDANGVATGVVKVEDYKVVRGEMVLRNQAGGSMKLWALTGLNDSSPDIGFGIAFASKAL